MSQIFSKATPNINVPPPPAPPPAAMSPSGAKPTKQTQVPSLLGLAAAGKSQDSQSKGGKSLLGQ